MPGRLQDRVALITGASRGIGAAVAQCFAAEGAHVVLVARTVGGLEEVDDTIRAAGGTATLVPLDLRDFAGIDRMAAALAERFGRLDILVGNAATLGELRPVPHYSPEMWAEVIELNLTSNWHLIRAFDGLLRRSSAGRALFVSSNLVRHPRAYWGPYAASKAALENLVLCYAAEIAATSVRANVIDPGRVRTRMRAQAYPGEDPAKHPAPALIAPRLIEWASAAATANGQIIAVA
ncbi:MAG: SDR family NAD(P)-dependent oxidoreductase [Alphaproteobacteria bacterium]|nr:SDR family NAD(P)-dependent oxidoreductase [Alphaproteobacteria bacterium]